MDEMYKNHFSPRHSTDSNCCDEIESLPALPVGHEIVLVVWHCLFLPPLVAYAIAPCEIVLIVVSGRESRH